jgi:curved DNA-binding protein CbpA
LPGRLSRSEIDLTGDVPMPETARIRTFYDELGVGPMARSSEIKRAFRDVARRYHPDVNPPERQAWAHERMSRFNFIVDTLLDPASRREYDRLVRKYERDLAPRKPRRTRRQMDALQQELARVSVEIMNLAGKYSNCRLKMLVGIVVALASVGIVAVGTWLSVEDIYLDFIRFFVLVGAITAGIGLSDLIGRKHCRNRIRELEFRQAELRRRLYESLTMYSTY